MIKEGEEKARTLITEKKEMIRKMADLLMEKETIGIDEISEIFGPRPFELSIEFQKYLEEKKKADCEVSAN